MSTTIDIPDEVYARLECEAQARGLTVSQIIAQSADILVYTPEEFERMGETGLGWIVRQEGVTLYERPPA